MTGEDASWTQTFITVTPQDDGFLREIDESTVVSGVADAPLNVGNIVLRRSLMNTTKNFINPTELETSRRISAECQTYLQGVPKVELPLVHRDEATQTLYMRSDADRTAAVRSLCDIITVMNEKPLPEWKTTRIVQTIITINEETSTSDDLTKQLQSDISDAISIDDDKLIVQEIHKEIATAEVSDLLNFVIDRTLWMTEPEPVPDKERRDVEVQTFIKYNETTKKITTDHEVQTTLSCEPKYSNTMLLFEYSEAKNCCESRIEECLEKGVYPRIMIDDIIDNIMTNCDNQINFPWQEETARKLAEISEAKKISRIEETNCQIRKCPARCKVCPKSKPKTQRIEDILFADCPSYVVRTTASGENDQNLTPACPPFIKMQDTGTAISNSSLDDTSFTLSIEETASELERNLTSLDEEALGMLKSAFCNPATCSKR